MGLENYTACNRLTIFDSQTQPNSEAKLHQICGIPSLCGLLVLHELLDWQWFDFLSFLLKKIGLCKIGNLGLAKSSLAQTACPQSKTPCRPLQHLLLPAGRGFQKLEWCVYRKYSQHTVMKWRLWRRREQFQLTLSRCWSLCSLNTTHCSEPDLMVLGLLVLCNRESLWHFHILWSKVGDLLELSTWGPTTAERPRYDIAADCCLIDLKSVCNVIL